MGNWLKKSEAVGLARATIDSHTLGISTLEELVTECGFSAIVADEAIVRAFSDPRRYENFLLIRHWLAESRISVLGFSYRLGVESGLVIFRRLMSQLREHGMLAEEAGPLTKVCFAGLPAACDAVRSLFKGKVEVFYGDETPAESLLKLGIDPILLPRAMGYRHPYDTFREELGGNVVKGEAYRSVLPPDRRGAPHFGGRQEHVLGRIEYAQAMNQPPLMRAHAGPYSADSRRSVGQFLEWCKVLAEARFLDVLSIGTSQLTQERFGESWDDRPNGGGVPVNSPEEYCEIYNASRPMLVRVYAGTKNIPYLARVHEETLNIAWHALSLWWFSQIDGRGPHGVLGNLDQHFETLRYVAATGKPYEPNVPHHFAFRGADDVTYVVSAYLAARTAKALGVRNLIVQVMLNDPKYTWGVMDLAKARAALVLVRGLEDPSFRVLLQARAGLDYLSHDTAKAKGQLASVTALMDDIEPRDATSPQIVHVVSYSEGSELATPEVINESVQITLSALNSYRELKRRREVEDMSENPEVSERATHLRWAAGQVIRTIEQCIDAPYCPRGLHEVFELGFLPVPQLRFLRDRYPEAIRWKTKIRDGRVDTYDGETRVDVRHRMEVVKERAAKDRGRGRR